MRQVLNRCSEDMTDVHRNFSSTLCVLKKSKRTLNPWKQQILLQSSGERFYEIEDYFCFSKSKTKTIAASIVFLSGFC